MRLGYLATVDGLDYKISSNCIQVDIMIMSEVDSDGGKIVNTCPTKSVAFLAALFAILLATIPLDGYHKKKF